MAFKLDTSGEVGDRVTGDMFRRGYAIGPLAGRPRTWNDLSPFTQGYVEAMFASFHCPSAFEPLAFSDFAPETLARIMTDCEAMQGRDDAFTPADGERNWTARQAGYFKSVRFLPLTPYLGDDGLIYLRDA